MLELVSFIFLVLSFLSLSPLALWHTPAMAAALPPPNNVALSHRQPIMQAVNITQPEFGDAWPFTVPEGILSCRGSSEVVFTAKGMSFALNGFAKGAKQYADLRPIWAPHPSLSGAQRDIGPIIDRGLTLCR